MIKKISPDDPIHDILRREKSTYEDYRYPNNLTLFENFFSNVDYSYGHPLNTMYDWVDINNIPDCRLFNLTISDINFKKTPVASARNFDIIELPLQEVLMTLGNDAYVLSPQRWYGVKKQLSNLTIEYPEITICNSSNKPTLMDGRHRIVAMIKFLGLKTAPFVCDPAYTQQIKEYYK